MEESKRISGKHTLDSHSTSSSESFDSPVPLLPIDDNSYPAVIKSMLKMVYKCLESPNDSVYDSGLSTLESVISMFGSEIRLLSGPICSLLKARARPQHAKRINKIKQSLIGKAVK